MVETLAEPLAIEPGVDLTTACVAKQLSLNQDSVLRCIRQGVRVPGLPERVKLRAYRLCGQYRIKQEDLKLFLEQQNPGRAVELAGEAKARQKRADAAHKKLRKMLGKD